MSLEQQVAELLDKELSVATELEATEPEVVETEDKVVEEEQDAVASEDTDEDEQEDDSPLTPADVSISDLLEAFGEGTEVSQLYDIKVPMPDGAEPMSIGQLKDAFVSEKRINKTAEQMEAERKEFEQVRNSTLAQLSQVGQISNRMLELNAMAYAVEQEYEATNWAEEEKSNPGGAALKRQKFADAMDQINAERQQTVQADMQMRHQQWSGYAMNEYNQMLAAVPEWQNEETRGNEYNQIKAVLESYHFSPEDIALLVDHRHMRLLRDFAKLKAAADSADTVKEKFNKSQGKKRGLAPVSGQRRVVGKRVAGKLKRIDAAVERGKSSTDLSVKANAISELLNNR